MNLYYGSYCSCSKSIKKPTMTVTVKRPNVTVIYSNVVKIETENDGGIRMVCNDDSIFVTKGKYEIDVEE